MNFRTSKKALYNGVKPKYPDILNVYNSLAKSVKSMNKSLIRSVVAGEMSFFKGAGITTSDGGEWYAVYFAHGLNEIIVAFPFAFDVYDFGRSIAFYAKDVPKRDLEIFTRMFLKKWVELTELSKGDLVDIFLH